jgi:hypothetical protein
MNDFPVTIVFYFQHYYAKNIFEFYISFILELKYFIYLFEKSTKLDTFTIILFIKL